MGWVNVHQIFEEFNSCTYKYKVSHEYSLQFSRITHKKERRMEKNEAMVQKES